MSRGYDNGEDLYNARHDVQPRYGVDEAGELYDRYDHHEDNDSNSWMGDSGIGNPFESISQQSQQIVEKEKADRKKLLRIGGIVVAVAVVAGGIFFVNPFKGGSPSTTQASSSSPTSTVTASSPSDEQPGSLVSGNGAGDQSSGSGVIQAFDYAYYNNRDGFAAYKFFAPGVTYKAADLQAAIDKDVSAQETYHLEIYPTQKENVYYVILKLATKGGETYDYVFSQKFITEKGPDGKFYIRDYSTFDVS